MITQLPQMENQVQGKKEWLWEQRASVLTSASARGVWSTAPGTLTVSLRWSPLHETFSRIQWPFFPGKPSQPKYMRFLSQLSVIIFQPLPSHSIHHHLVIIWGTKPLFCRLQKILIRAWCRTHNHFISQVANGVYKPKARSQQVICEEQLASGKHSALWLSGRE